MYLYYSTIVYKTQNFLKRLRFYFRKKHKNINVISIIYCEVEIHRLLKFSEREKWKWVGPWDKDGFFWSKYTGAQLIEPLLKVVYSITQFFTFRERENDASL